NADPIDAYRALGSLLASPAEQVVSFLEDKLKPTKHVPGHEIDLLIADLGSEVYKARQRATHRLLEILPQSKAAMTRSLEKNLPLEQHRRVAQLVAVLKRREVSPEDLRELRAIELLEAIASPHATRLLKSLADGHPAARLTDEAIAALERMEPP